MLKKFILSGIVTISFTTGLMANNYSKDIYAEVGSNENYEFGLSVNYNDLISNLNYLNIDNKDLYKGSVYYPLYEFDNLYYSLGAGVIHSKVDDIKETKPTIDSYLVSYIPYLGRVTVDGYIANNYNLGTKIEMGYKILNLFKDRIRFGGNSSNDDEFTYITIGLGIDKIQGEIEKSIFLKLNYMF